MPVLPVVHRFGFRIEAEAPHLPPTAHAHAEIELAWLHRGSARMAFVGGEAALARGRLSAHFAGFPHRLVARSTDAFVTWVTLPLEAAADGLVPGSLLRACLGGAVVIDPDPLPGDQAWIERCAADWRRSPAWTAQVREELRVRLHRLALAAGLADGPRTGSGPFLAQAVGGLIAAAEDPGATLASVARRIGYHPTYFVQRFRRLTGHGALAVLTRLRVARAMRILTERSTLDQRQVAARAGFGSVRAMQRGFVRICGRTPGAWLRLADRPATDR